MKHWISLLLVVALAAPSTAALAASKKKGKSDSGTIGRLNKGASPKHPEGAGNPSGGY